VVGAAVQRGNNFRCVRRIAQCHSNIAQPALVSDAADGAALSALQELRFAPVEQIHQLRIIEPVAGCEILLPRRPGIFVPRAEQLAVIATVDAISHSLAKLHRNGAIQFYGQVGNAAPCIQFERCDYRLRGAYIDAGSAAAAVFSDRFISG